MKRNKQKRANCSFAEYEAYPIDLLNKQSNVLDGTLSLRSLFEDDAFTKTSHIVPIACGYEESGLPNIQDLCQFPHLFIGGDAGSGKSSFLNVILFSILYRKSPEDIRLFLVDTKGEFKKYEGIPHLAIPVIKSAERAIAALYWLCREMRNRFIGMSKLNATDIESYNDALREKGEKTCPRIVFVVDELKHLLDILPDETESLLCQIAQLGRWAGIYLVVSSQHINPEVFTDLLSANFHSRAVFRLASQRSSWMMLNDKRAANNQHAGEMILSRLIIQTNYKMMTPYVSTTEIGAVTTYLRRHYGKKYDLCIIHDIKNRTRKMKARLHKRKSILGRRKGSPHFMG